MFASCSCMAIFAPQKCPGGGIGRRTGLKHQRVTMPVRSRPWVHFSYFVFGKKPEIIYLRFLLFEEEEVKFRFL